MGWRFFKILSSARRPPDSPEGVDQDLYKDFYSADAVVRSPNYNDVSLPMERYGNCMIRFKFFACIILFSVCNIQEVFSMGVLNLLISEAEPEKYVISSPLEGRMMRGGEPLRHFTFYRYMKWTEYTEEDRTVLIQEFTTDDEGYFSLPEYSKILKIPGLNEFIATMDLRTVGNDENTTFHSQGKMNKELYAELGLEPENFICDFENDDVVVRSPNLTMSRCRWNGMEIVE